MNHFWVWFSLACAAPPVAWLLYRYQPWVRGPFINKTDGLMNDKQLRTLWDSAAHDLATGPFPLNVFGAAGDPPASASEQMHAADPRAIGLRPRAITVRVHEDTNNGDGWLDGRGRTEPLAVRGLTRCNKLQPIVITISRRWATQVLPYEFQNAMLAMLGYDVSGR